MRAGLTLAPPEHGKMAEKCSRSFGGFSLAFHLCCVQFDTSMGLISDLLRDSPLKPEQLENIAVIEKRLQDEKLSANRELDRMKTEFDRVRTELDQARRSGQNARARGRRMEAADKVRLRRFGPARSRSRKLRHGTVRGGSHCRSRL